MRAQFASQATLEILTRGLVAVCTLVGSAIAIMSIRTVIDVRSARVLNAESQGLEAQVKRRVQPAPHGTDAGIPGPRGLDALRILQAAVTQDAARHHCQLSEFKSATQMAPYASRYKKSLPDQPWSQMDAHFTINGRLRDVMETLRSLNDVSVPVEMDAVSIARDKISEDGSTTVNAQIDLRALTQGAPV